MRSVLRHLSVGGVFVLLSLASAARTHTLTTSATALAFGPQNIGTTSTQSLTVTDSGSGAVQIQSVTINGSSAFQVSGFSSPVTLQPNGTLKLNVSFTPTAVASYSGTLTISGSGGASASVALSGSGSGTTSTTVYSNIDDSTILDPGGGTYGWGWCGTPSCAGGGSTATQQISWGQQPSLDGGSTQFFVSGSAWADGLWWYKVGPNDTVANFQFDFWLNVSQEASSYSQALEFDVFQFIVPTRYMFGTQCDYTHGYNSGTWDVWNEVGGGWYHTSYACPGFVPGDWYHITWSFDRTADGNEHYNSVSIQHYDSSGANQLDSSTTPIGVALMSGPLPSGWNDNLGVQFQLDINGAPGSTGTASYTTQVDKVTLTVW